jgi:subtilisin-like proprotein convertase family protein/PKD repeat protein
MKKNRLFIVISVLVLSLILTIAATAQEGKTPEEKYVDLRVDRDVGATGEGGGILVTTYAYTSTTPVAITDNACATGWTTSTITVTNSFSIADLKVGVWIAHTYRGNVELQLHGPDGTEVSLIAGLGGNADNLNVLFDESSTNVADTTSHVAPPPYYYVTWNPVGNLNNYHFLDAQGPWSLQVCDDYGGETGTLNTWTLFFETDTIFIDPAFQSDSACPNCDVAYNFEVGNTTGITQSFTLDYSNVWPTNGPAATAIIPNNASEVITVSVHIPWTANPGDYDVLTITASGGGETVTSTATTIAALIEGWQDYADVPLSSRVRDHSVVYYDDKLYVIGGYNGAASASLQIYDISANTWMTGTSMTAARYWIDCVEINAKIYCAGGYTTTAQNTLYIYDISTNTWSTGAALPAARSAYSGVALDGKYYVIGGYTTAYENTMIVYDPVTNTWDSTRASMSVARRYAAAGVIGGHIYVAGGLSGISILTNSTEVYDPVANTWSPRASLPLSGWVRGADGVTHDRYLVWAGGYAGDTTASSYVLVYDAVNNSWAFQPALMSHLLYSMEGDVDGDGNFWIVSGRLYEGTWGFSRYTTKMVACAACTPVSGADFTVDPISPLVGIPSVFTASVTAGSPAITYAWDFGDSGTGNGKTITHTFASAGTYTVTLKASNCDGANSTTATHSVVVRPAIIEFNVYLPLMLKVTGGTP